MLRFAQHDTDEISCIATQPLEGRRLTAESEINRVGLLSQNDHVGLVLISELAQIAAGRYLLEAAIGLLAVFLARRALQRRRLSVTIARR